MGAAVSDAVTVQNFCRYRGSRKAIVLCLTNTTSDLDITGWTFSLDVNPEPSPNPGPADTFSVAGVILVAIQTSATAPAEVEFTPSAGNADQEPGTYYYNIIGTDGAGLPDVLLAGEWVVLQGINLP